MRKTLTGIALIMATVTAIVIAVLTANGSHLPLCETEDASTQAVCYWDAERQGNGKGLSFVAYDYGTTIVYVR